MLSLLATYIGDVVSYSDYSPYGVQPDGRFGSTSDEYRYGFNGQEEDNEISGEGNSYTAEFWQYSPRIARRWNIDPIVKPHESSYVAFANNPIWFLDPNGADTTTITKHSEIIQQEPMPGDRGTPLPLVLNSTNVDVKAAEGPDVFFYTTSITEHKTDGTITSSSRTYQLDPNDNATRQGIFKMDYAYFFEYNLTDQQSLARILPSDLIEYFIEKNTGWDELAFKSIRGYQASYPLIDGLNTAVQVAYSFYIPGGYLKAALSVNRINSTTRLLGAASKGTGNFGVGTATWNEANIAGEAWVGQGHRIASDGKTMVSADGLRQFRPPSWKPKLGINQANFEMRTVPKGQWTSNGHVDIQ